MPDFVSNEQIVMAAHQRLAQGPWDYLVGGSESETTLRRNRQAFDRVALRPRILRDVGKIDTSTTFLGQNLRIPVLLAPIGSLQAFTPTGGVAAAEAAHEFGVMPVISTATEPGPETIAAATPGPKIFQLYVRGDDDWVAELLGRVATAGYVGLAITVDLAVDSNRERPMISGYVRLSRRGGRVDPVFQARLDWDRMEQYRKLMDVPVMIKGVQTAEDAELCMEHNVDVIWVSNHGGRQMDHAMGTLDTLREVTEVVQGRVPIVLDGGVQRATDVLKAIALGADVVAIGRLTGWGLAANGKDGLVRVLEILEHEMISAMGLLGITSIDELGPEFVRDVPAVTHSHEMSSWVNMPGGRLL
jgi:isopentenyl diphosphate isomerase/L-lactate dehydrogenase-like FMN-dependent dehydrogenase